MTGRDKQPDKLSRPEALKVVREIAANFADIVYSPHARERIVARRIEREALWRVIQTGNIVEGPALDMTGQWAMRIEGKAAGARYAVALAIEWRSLLVVVTAFELRDR